MESSTGDSSNHFAQGESSHATPHENQQRLMLQIPEPCDRIGCVVRPHPNMAHEPWVMEPPVYQQPMQRQTSHPGQYRSNSTGTLHKSPSPRMAEKGRPLKDPSSFEMPPLSPEQIAHMEKIAAEYGRIDTSSASTSTQTPSDGWMRNFLRLSSSDSRTTLPPIGSIDIEPDCDIKPRSLGALEGARALEAIHRGSDLKPYLFYPRPIAPYDNFTFDQAAGRAYERAPDEMLSPMDRRGMWMPPTKGLLETPISTLLAHYSNPNLPSSFANLNVPQTPAAHMTNNLGGGSYDNPSRLPAPSAGEAQPVRSQLPVMVPPVQPLLPHSNLKRGRTAAFGEGDQHDSESDDNHHEASASATTIRGKKPKHAETAQPKTKAPANWVCAFAGDECDTDSRDPRKGFSDYFGRNKTCTMAIPPETWRFICRKHYQRGRYRGKKAQSYHHTKAHWIIEQMHKIEVDLGAKNFPGFNVEYTIQFNKNLQMLVQQAHARVAKGEPAIVQPVGQEQADKAKELEVALELEKYNGEQKYVADCEKYISRLLNAVDRCEALDLPRVEFLPVLHSGKRYPLK